MSFTRVLAVILIGSLVGLTGTRLVAQGPESVMDLKGTWRLPDADGSAKVHQRGRVTTISLVLDDMKPASLFGGDYSTFILWAVSYEGKAANLGELVLNGDQSEQSISTRFVVSRLLVTAEPHFLVEKPSRFVVLDSVTRVSDQGVNYQSFQGSYYYERDSLENALEARGEVRAHVNQALTAFRLAQRAGASTLAKEDLLLAERALDTAITLSRMQADSPVLESQAREAVRLAVAAETAARARSASGAQVSQN
jgi:hypothetical protein